MADLSTRYLGLDLRSPLVASSSPLTGAVDSLLRLEGAGAGAVVLPSLFEEDLAEETQQVDALQATGATGARPAPATQSKPATVPGRPPTCRWSPRPRRPCRSR